MDVDNHVSIFASIIWIYCFICFKLVYVDSDHLPNENRVSTLHGPLSPPDRLSVISHNIHFIKYWIQLFTRTVSPVVSVGNVFLDLVNSVPSVLTKFI